MKDNKFLAGGALYVIDENGESKKVSVDSLPENETPLLREMSVSFDIVQDKGFDLYQELWIKAIQEDEEVYYENGKHRDGCYEEFHLRLPEIRKEYGKEIRIRVDDYPSSEYYRGNLYESIKVLVVNIILSRTLDEEDVVKSQVEELVKFLKEVFLNHEFKR